MISTHTPSLQAPSAGVQFVLWHVTTGRYYSITGEVDNRVDATRLTQEEAAILLEAGQRRGWDYDLIQVASREKWEARWSELRSLHADLRRLGEQRDDERPDPALEEDARRLGARRREIIEYLQRNQPADEYLYDLGEDAAEALFGRLWPSLEWAHYRYELHRFTPDQLSARDAEERAA